jgi:uncharacterized protein YkwD
MTASRTVVLLLPALAVCGGAAPPVAADPAPARAPAGLATAMVAEHNRYRAQHCAPPVAWSAELAAYAQRWADSLRDHRCAFEHSRGKYGENLAAGTGGMLDPAAVVAMWYGEVSAYDFKKGGGFSMATGHFSQVVWRGTTRIGCAKSTCFDADLTDIWVCSYDPPGNVEGAYHENVRPRGCRP